MARSATGSRDSSSAPSVRAMASHPWGTMASGSHATGQTLTSPRESRLTSRSIIHHGMVRWTNSSSLAVSSVPSASRELDLIVGFHIYPPMMRRARRVQWSSDQQPTHPMR